MEIKIFKRSVVPDRIVLYENDFGCKNLVFTVSKVNDGVNLEVLDGYLEIERDLGNSDRFLLQKTVIDELIYFTLPISVSLTQISDVLSSQIVFENLNKTISYRSKVFYIEVKYSVDGESSYEQVLPTVISQLEESIAKSVDEVKNAESNVIQAKEDINAKLSEDINNIKNDIEESLLNYVDNMVDSELSTESTNPVQNKVVTEALEGKLNSENSTNKNLLYSREQGVNKYREFVSAINANSLTYSGKIPTYREVGGNGTSQLTTGTPGGEFSCINLKYFNDNIGAKLYKHTLTFESDYSYIDPYEFIRTDTFECVILSTQNTPITIETNRQPNWYILPEICILVDAKILNHSYYSFVYGKVGNKSIDLKFNAEGNKFDVQFNDLYGGGYTAEFANTVYSNFRIIGTSVEEL